MQRCPRRDREMRVGRGERSGLPRPAILTGRSDANDAFSISGVLREELVQLVAKCMLC